MQQSDLELRRLALACLAAVLVCWAVLLASSSRALALIQQPTTIDGPSADGLSLGGAAASPDGTGGLVYVKTVEGVPHVFASRFDGGSWSAPIRVDWDQPYEASQPRIAAGSNGRLMVVWVTQVATLPNGELRRGLWSASLGPKANAFGRSLLVDPNVGTGIGGDPSLAGAATGKAIVAYRVITHVFERPGEFTNSVQLRPGDVMADIRVARLEGDHWSRLGPINRFPAASMRAPTETNGPKVAIGDTGRAVVAWQEPDLTGTARVLIRRITGTTLGPIFLASPETWNGKPVNDDASAFGLDVTGFDQARVAVRIDGSPSSSLHGQRVFLTTLGSSFSDEGAKPTGPELADGGGESPPSGPIGPPAVAASDDSGKGALLLVFSAGGGMRLVGVNHQGALLSPQSFSDPSPAAGTPAVAAVDPEGGGISAFRATDGTGSPTVAVRQEYPSGGSQTGLLYGPLGGQISQLAGGGSGSGEALLAFRQGESGRFAIVADRVAAPPEKFAVMVPNRWVSPKRAKVRWPVPPSGVGGLVYGLVLDGRVVRSGLRRRQITPAPGLLGNGVRRVQVLATDRLGQDVLSRPVKLRIDSQPPRPRLRVKPRKGMVVLKLDDPQSGLLARATRVAFGDGERARGGGVFHHRYQRPGRYTVRLRAIDKVHNRLSQRIRVVIR